MSASPRIYLVRLLTAIGCLAGAPTSAAAQNAGVIAGYVRTDGAGAPVVGASVTLVSSNAVARTNAIGYFALTDVAPGEHTLLVQAIGHEPTLLPGHLVRSGALTTVDLQVSARGVRLDPVEVRATPAERKATADVAVLTSADLPPDGDVVLSLQGRIPGLQVSHAPGISRSAGRTDNLLTTLRGKRVLWVLDGNTVAGNLTFYVDTGDVECLEVRQGSRAVLEYIRGSQRPSEYGGVILVWTHTSNRPPTGSCS